MILTTVRHGRTGRDVRNLLAHLNKQLHQTSRVIRIDGVPVSNADDAMAYMQTMRDASRATVACHHISISPRIHLTAEQIDEAVQRILAAMGAQDHAYVLWQHSEKSRAATDVADEHYHLVVSHVGPDGRALDDSWSFVRMEAAARALEADFGEDLTRSRFTKSVAKELRRIGRDDVADMLVTPPTPPTSSMSAKTRARADRHGLDLPEAQAAVRTAWTASDSPAAFRAALKDSGFEVRPGTRPNVFVVIKDGVEVGALDRIVKQKRAAVAARMNMKEEGNVRPTEAAERAEKRGRGDLFRDTRRERILPEPSALIAAARRYKRRAGAESDRRVERTPDGDHRNSRVSKQRNRSHQERLRTNVAVARLNGSDFHTLRTRVKAVANGPDVKTPRRRLEERAAVTSFQALNFDDVKPIITKVVAGRILDHTELETLRVVRMKSLKPARKLDYKAQLLAEVAPGGFDAAQFADDIHMVKKPTPGRPTARVMTRDGGWLEFDVRTRKPIRTWGATGRAQVLAAAMAAIIGVEVEHLAKTASVGADANFNALHVTKMAEDQVKSLAMWWSARGYVAVPATDGCWIDVGSARIRDTGNELEIHGGVTDEAINAILLKAGDAWGGGVALDGHWTQAEQDRLWIVAQRRGITVENCRPSQMIQTAWRREQDASAKSTKTISSVRTKMIDAQDLLAGARGDRNAVIRLPGNLQAFLAIYLDDDQRKELSGRSIADVIPQLARFREIGAVELESWERRTGRKFAPPRPDPESRTEENRLEIR
jgi:hypothetical protein